MTKNYKLNYNQYKHLIDVCLTGDFLNESLDKPMGLVTYRKLLTEDNILYFTQNTKRTCRIPLGLQKKDSKLKFIDLLERKFDYRHSDKELLLNLAKSIICYLLQSYKPDEYEIYCDLEIEQLKDVSVFTFIPNEKMLDDVYSNLIDTKHKTFCESGSYNYKEFRKKNSDKLSIFILTSPSNITRLNTISANHLRYGICVLNLVQNEIVNSSTLSLNNCIRPNISDLEMNDEIMIYKRMLGELNIMNNEINLLTGEILNKGNLHENLIVRIPLSGKEKELYDKLKDKAAFMDENSEKYSNLMEDLGVIERGYAIYNMREYGYQFGGIHANGDYGSFYHHLLRDSRNLDEESLRYIIGSSVYSLFSHSSCKLSSALRLQKDLSGNDKKILNEYIDRQVEHYAVKRPWFSLDEFDEDYEDMQSTDKVFYNTFFCKIELKDRRLFVTVNNKTKQLPNSLLYYVDLDKMSLNTNLVELIVRYEMYLEYGVNVPIGICDIWYIDDKFILEHNPVVCTGIPSDLLKTKIQYSLDLVVDELKTYETITIGNLSRLVKIIYGDMLEETMISYRNYWLLHAKEFMTVLKSVIENSRYSNSLDGSSILM